jgi:hypothetical protein
MYVLFKLDGIVEMLLLGIFIIFYYIKNYEYII